MIIDKRSKIVIGIIMFLELLFLTRAYIVHSFYKNDELYGDGITNIAKYDRIFINSDIFCFDNGFFISYKYSNF